MKKGIGRSMEIYVNPFSVEPDVVPEKSRALLASEKRLRILEYLLNFPCASAAEICRNTGLSPNSTRWHLRCLLEGGYLTKIGKSHAPSGFVLSQHALMFTSFHNLTEYEISELIVRRGPLEKAEIKRATRLSPQLLSYHLKKLEKSGVLVKVKGIYELAFNLMDFQRTYGRAVENYLAELAMEAKKEGVLMEISRKRHEFAVFVSIPDEVELRIHEVPFYELLG